MSFNFALQVSPNISEQFPEPLHGIRSVGVMTCGGDCPGLNPVVRSVVIAACRQYGWKVLGIEDAMQGLINLEYKSPYGNLWLSPFVVEDIIGLGGTIIGTDNKSDPFRFKVLENGVYVEKDISAQVVENFKKLELDALIVIGGDGTMRIANKLFHLGIPCVGIPKTIDNDLLGTDQTFGFDTAVGNICNAIDKIKDTARSHDRIFIVETMGRDAGWLALYSGIAGAADVILIPEIPYSLECILNKIKTRKAKGMPFTIIVIAEGAREVDKGVSIEEQRELGKMPKYSGAGSYLSNRLQELIDHEVRFTVLGHIQRGGSPSAFDRILGTRFGVEAVRLVAQKKFGHMVALRCSEIVTMNMDSCTGGQKLVDPHSEVVQQAKIMGICFGDEKI